VENWNWADEDFEKDRADWGNVLGLGLMSYELAWLTPQSIVALRLSGGNLQGDFLIMYSSRDLFNEARKAFEIYFTDHVGAPTPYFR
jgi:hypothetical protein